MEEKDQLWFNTKISSIKHYGEFISKKENRDKLSDKGFREAVIEEWGRNLQRIGDELLEWGTPIFERKRKKKIYLELKQEFENEKE